jgi:soluble lytic murein transglycosylase-like protein
MKLSKLLLGSLVLVAVIGASQYPSAQGKSGEPMSGERANRYFNRPMDHRYKLIVHERDEAAIFDIASRHSYEKSELVRILVEAARKYDLEPALLVAIAAQESMFDPYARSHMGAMGLMQLMPATAKRFGVKNILDPRQNAQGAARYVKYLRKTFEGNDRFVIASYNAGSGAVLQYNDVPPFAQTQNFVVKVLEYREHYRQVLQ